MKRKAEGRTVLLHPEVKDALAEWIAGLRERAPVSNSTPVFLRGFGPRHRKDAWRILTTYYAGSNLPGTLGTPAVPKTFANKSTCGSGGIS